MLLQLLMAVSTLHLAQCCVEVRCAAAPPVALHRGPQELFLQELALKAHASMADSSRKTLEYKDVGESHVTQPAREGSGGRRVLSTFHNQGRRSCAATAVQHLL